MHVQVTPVMLQQTVIPRDPEAPIASSDQEDLMAVFDFMKRRGQQGGNRPAPDRRWDEKATPDSEAGGHNPAAALAAMLAALDLASVADEPVQTNAPSLARRAHPDRPAQRDQSIFIGGASRM